MKPLQRSEKGKGDGDELPDHTTNQGCPLNFSRQLASISTLHIRGVQPGPGTQGPSLAGSYFIFPSFPHQAWVAQLCPPLYDPMDCSLSGSLVHGIFQARILEWEDLLQGIFPTQRSNLHLQCLLRWQTNSSPLRHWEALSFPHRMMMRRIGFFQGTILIAGIFP